MFLFIVIIIFHIVQNSMLYLLSNFTLIITTTNLLVLNFLECYNKLESGNCNCTCGNHIIAHWVLGSWQHTRNMTRQTEMEEQRDIFFFLCCNNGNYVGLWTTERFQDLHMLIKNTWLVFLLLGVIELSYRKITNV